MPATAGPRSSFLEREHDNLNGFVGGGQVGYNWRFGGLVVGLEGDFQGSSQSLTDSATIGGVAFTGSEKLPWFATARGRIGFAQVPWRTSTAPAAPAWVDGRVSITALGTTL